MLAFVKNYIDFMFDYQSRYSNSWKDYIRFFAGFAVAVILVDFVWELDWASGSIVFLFVLLVFEFIWANIAFIFRDRV